MIRKESKKLGHKFSLNCEDYSLHTVYGPQNGDGPQNGGFY